MTETSLQGINQYTDELVALLSTKARKTLARDIAFSLRKSNRERIRAQISADGMQFIPRKLNPKYKKSRRAMFLRIRTAKYLKVKATPNQATLSITGRAGAIAQVHQFGHSRYNERAKKIVKYPKRPLLGINNADLSRIENLIINYLASMN